MKFSCCSLDKEEITKISQSDHKNKDFIDLLKLIAHPVRLKILQILAIESEILTCELTDIIYDSDGNALPQPAITKQLTKMKKEGILSSRKVSFDEKDGEIERVDKADGKYTSYCLVEDKRELITYLIQPSISNKYQPQIKVVAMKMIKDSTDDILNCLSSCNFDQ